jgi:hypothetical protein
MTRIEPKVAIITTALFAAVLYIVCAAFRPIFPDWPMYELDRWVALFPGFTWTTLGVLIGLIEATLYGALGSALYVGLFNAVGSRVGAARTSVPAA